MEKRSSPNRHGAESNVTVWRGLIHSRERHSSRRCVKQLVINKKPLGGIWLAGRSCQASFHLFRLDLCSYFMNLLFQLGCVLKSFRSCQERKVILKNNMRCLPRNRRAQSRRTRNESWRSQLRTLISYIC